MKKTFKITSNNYSFVTIKCYNTNDDRYTKVECVVSPTTDISLEIPEDSDDYEITIIPIHLFNPLYTNEN